jgi:segregation and condensation protein A
LSESYKISLPQFEGPFDLLLFFIERDELDIYDIPIAKVADDFLTHLHEMDSMNIELASEFILVAATLMRIKAKLLLPRKELDEQGNEIDPRKELVDKLIEYRKFKAVLEDLQWMEDERQKIFGRGNIPSDMIAIQREHEKEAELHSLTMFKLLESFQKVLKRFEENQNRPQHVVIKFAYTIEEEKGGLLAFLRTDKQNSFTDIFTSCKDRIQAIFRFLALLELVQLAFVNIDEVDGMNDFKVRQLTEDERQEQLAAKLEAQQDNTQQPEPSAE